MSRDLRPLDDEETNPAEHGERETPTRRGRGRNRRNTLNDLTGTEWIKATKSWLICDSRRYHQNRDTELHPARYPEELVADFLRFFTMQGGWVLDPFCGSGATLVAALEEGRNAIGVELSRRYATLAQNRLTGLCDGLVAEVIRADARQIGSPDLWRDGPAPVGDDGLPRFDFIMTSPPYWNMLRKSRGGVHSTHKERAAQGLDTDYGESDGNLGLIEQYDDFVEALGNIFEACGQLLRPRKYLVVVAQNVRVPDGYVRPLAWDIARRVSRAPGLSFQGERIWCQDSKKLGIWGYPTTFVPNYHHHYCLIFRRED
ncbi:MAG: DNA methyltransferase [Armatimonadota bacterium]|jgi:DNA modification methylase